MLKRNDVPFQEEEFLALLALCEHPAQEQHMGMVLSEMREVLHRVCTCMYTHTTGARARTHTHTQREREREREKEMYVCVCVCVCVCV